MLPGPLSSDAGGEKSVKPPQPSTGKEREPPPENRLDVKTFEGGKEAGWPRTITQPLRLNPGGGVLWNPSERQQKTAQKGKETRPPESCYGKTQAKHRQLR